MTRQRPGRLCLPPALALVLALLPATSVAARVVLVGLDGASWNVIDPMLAAGELPNLGAIIRSGVSAELETVEPVTSPVVWTSIATGRTPEHHGVTDFFKTALSVRVPTVFERLAARGVRVGLYDYLMTWPPADLPKGFVIPGWLRRDAAVTPHDVWSRIALDPWVNSYAPLKTSDDYRQNALDEISRKAPRWNQLAERFDLEVGAVSFYAPDGMSHRFWHGAFPQDFDAEIAATASGPERSALRDAMRGADRAIGEIRSKLQPEDTILIASDHGFRARTDPSVVWVSHIASALATARLDAGRDGFAILSEFGQLSIRVAPGEFQHADETTRRLAELIESCETTNGDGLFWAAEVLDVALRPAGHERSMWNELRQWLIRSVLDLAFDVQIEPNAHAVILAIPRGGLLAELTPASPVRIDGREATLSQVFSRQVFTGEHDPIAIFAAAGGPLRQLPQRGRISVLDIAPLIFHLAGSPIPDDLEGSLPVQWIAAGALSDRPVRGAPADSMPGIDRVGAAAQGGTDSALVEKLRRLGYIE